MSRKAVITIDGPAGSGKSTTARTLAQDLGYTYLDTGAMYRAVTLSLMEKGMPIEESDDLAELLSSIHLDLRYIDGEQHTFLNDKDISREIRSVEVTRAVSSVAGLRSVRQYLVAEQRQIARKGGYVVDGRDAGSVIFPDAEFKFFLTASLEARAKRRQKDLAEQGVEIGLDELKMELHRRDEQDYSRLESPLVKPANAFEIDNSHLSVSEQVEIMEKRIKES